MRNNNRGVIRKLSGRSLKHSRMRNTFAVLAIALTCMLFTTLSSMGFGLVQVSQEQTMREVGGRFHAGLKHATKEQMERVVKDPRVTGSSWNILIGTADNVIRRSAEIRYAKDESELENSFIELSEGRMPQKADEIIADTFVLDELGAEHALGAQISLDFLFYGQERHETFTVCGWYEGDGISHASQLYVSEAYWKQLKGERTDGDFAAWGKAHPEENGQGLYSVNLFFSSAKNIEETVRAVITDAGYEPETELDYGINWAYMSSRLEDIDASTAALLAAALLVVLVTGYLIICNIFQISVMNDIRFYGLLKTVGTTGRQLRSLIRRQALALSAAGIPLGLILGVLTGKVLFPFSMSFIDLRGVKAEVHFDPRMLLFGAAFSLATVLISCRKPGRIAGKVSPVEAVRYSEGTVKRKRKKSERGARVHRMALSNLGRNKKKTAFVILSLSLSVTILCVVLTAVGSFRLDGYLESRLVGDVVAGSTNYTTVYHGVGDFRVDPEFTQLLDSQSGVQARYGMWASLYQKYLVLDESAKKTYASWRADGVLRTGDAYSDSAIEESLRTGDVDTDVYAYDTELLSRLKVLDGELDAEKFQQGGYILLSPLIGDDTEDCFFYRPGDTVTVRSVTQDSEMQEIKNEDGETTDVFFTGLEERQYEVMAIVDTPASMTENRYAVNGAQLILPKEELAQEENGYCFAVSYLVDEEALDGFTAAAERYTEDVNPYMGFLTKAALEEEFGGMVNVIRTIGVAMSIVIAVIGVLNFINAILTGIIARKREFAVLCSVGMTGRQLKRMLMEEALYYVLISGAVSLVTGLALSWGVLHALNQVILFFAYRCNLQAYFIMLPLFAAAAAAAVLLAGRRIAGESIVERLRDMDS